MTEFPVVPGSVDRSGDRMDDLWMIEIERMHRQADDLAPLPSPQQPVRHPDGPVPSNPRSCRPGDDRCLNRALPLDVVNAAVILRPREAPLAERRHEGAVEQPRGGDEAGRANTETAFKRSAAAVDSGRRVFRGETQEFALAVGEEATLEPATDGEVAGSRRLPVVVPVQAPTQAEGAGRSTPGLEAEVGFDGPRAVITRHEEVGHLGHGVLFEERFSLQEPLEVTRRDVVQRQQERHLRHDASSSRHWYV